MGSWMPPRENRLSGKVGDDSAVLSVLIVPTNHPTPNFRRLLRRHVVRNSLDLLTLQLNVDLSINTQD
jgi:hypothetical protein